MKRRGMNGKVAVEEHFVTPALKGTIFGSIGWDPAEWRTMADRLQETDEMRLAGMDAGGIDISVLSLAAPCIQDEVEPRQAVARSTHANDALARIVERHPDRYAGLAALPLQDPTAAAAELERAVRDLGFCGALVNGWSSVGNLDTAAYYDEPQYLPFWDAVAGLDVPLYLHPRNPLPNARRLYEGREELLGPTWAFTVETATHALRLITSGLFDRYPSLTVVLGHLGELLPFAIRRTEQRLSRVPGLGLERRASEYFRDNFLITTSGNFHTPSLQGAIEELGVERILFAVDYPFEEVSEATEWFDAVPIAEDARRMIGSENARRVFGLPASDLSVSTT
jgi:predicted TIM-barrel fold metal-dependent hydrolase